MRGVPTERQAALAARQLHYHRARLRWIEEKTWENEALLLSYLTRLGTGAAVLPGGFRISGGLAAPVGDATVERLAPKNPYEQLVLRVGERRIARRAPLRDSTCREESREAAPEGGPDQTMPPERGPTYAARGCGRCFDGVVHVGSPTEVRTAPCPDCRGTGKVLSYLYPKPKGHRGPWPPGEAAAEGGRDRDARGSGAEDGATETKGSP